MFSIVVYTLMCKGGVSMAEGKNSAQHSSIYLDV